MKPQRLFIRRVGVVAMLCTCLIALLVAWRFASPEPPAASTALEIRWHGNGIVLQGKVKDAATQHALADGAAARLGGEADQVVDWLDIEPTALPVADAAALAELIRLGDEGWHLQRRPGDARLALQSTSDARSARAHTLLQRAFGPGVAVELVPLHWEAVNESIASE
ncbi:hypothetical protein [Variovorax boronicumulans]|uniref:hypothetical protein n=1 Tax=Variovorax boronicumulans TaxID=436515 RepID=UPI00339B6A15